MRDSDYYPAGAYNDPNAPYNEYSLEDAYGDDATAAIDEEIDCHDDNFVEWLIDSDMLAEEHTTADIEPLAKDDKVRDMYHKHRHDSMVEELWQKECDRQDYLRGMYEDMHDD